MLLSLPAGADAVLPLGHHVLSDTFAAVDYGPVLA